MITTANQSAVDMHVIHVFRGVELAADLEVAFPQPTAPIPQGNPVEHEGARLPSALV